MIRENKWLFNGLRASKWQICDSNHESVALKSGQILNTPNQLWRQTLQSRPQHLTHVWPGPRLTVNKPTLFSFSPPTLAHLGPSLATLTSPFLPMLLPIRATQPQPTLPPQAIKSPFQRINLPPSHNYQVCCRAIKSPLVLPVLPIKDRTQLGIGRRELRANSHLDRNDKA